jgi:hypothetical protein
MSLDFWKRCGIEVIGVERLSGIGFHPIYSIHSEAVIEAARRLQPLNPDVILLAGAGMPTLIAIHELANRGGPIAVSSVFCQGWHVSNIAMGVASDERSLRALLAPAAPWRNRIEDFRSRVTRRTELV